MIKVDGVCAPCLDRPRIMLPRDFLHIPLTRQVEEWLNRSAKVAARLNRKSWDDDDNYFNVGIEYMYDYTMLFLHPTTDVSTSAAMYCLNFCELADILA
jgi:hypothetical protein